MSGKVVCGAVTGVAAAAVVATGAVLIYGATEGGSDDVLNEETPIKWNQEDYFNAAPPEPRFSVYDDDECRKVVQEFYESGKSSYDRYTDRSAELDASL
mmetsp:Transcript_1030/g.1710  ORF Transcript_1030/g.1710 Transcript_1030/m.1710 type:complete len:99 (+) Transcript_1030:17-313(+)|eukprot:CAMPEP_0185579294 /NCGR_PEP_ID=MMETSP0434-20130131/14245_1 /TAXON_ID=626734 ORGANISM="Favella taraikaensis, Strain Fe Narragansett Bay" /NCGR_SAMPLE_ID=MMETSP0434 /ASSEMBLY_ACC=CAM_ASM_000379 /LENGTH=98 /DNA_ID=CAMNT_0028197289 /DNA_START=1 /DNA_END=297 /DNA_ORIENTATION=+